MASSDRDVKRERDISRIPRDDAVDSRDNQAVRPPSGNFHHMGPKKGRRLVRVL